MPLTPDAIKEFLAARILYAPGKAANAGGVSVSGLEMARTPRSSRGGAEEVDSKLRQIMADIHHQCELFGKESDGFVNYVKGANVAGFMKRGACHDGSGYSLTRNPCTAIRIRSGRTSPPRMVECAAGSLFSIGICAVVC